jgi:hypothetical protein
MVVLSGYEAYWLTVLGIMFHVIEFLFDQTGDLWRETYQYGTNDTFNNLFRI